MDHRGPGREHDPRLQHHSDRKLPPGLDRALTPANASTLTVWDAHLVFDGNIGRTWQTNTDRIFATLAVDDSQLAGVPGNIYSVFTDNLVAPGVNDIWFTRSSDRGNSWARPVKVNHDKGTHFFPWIAAGTTGRDPREEVSAFIVVDLYWPCPRISSVAGTREPDVVDARRNQVVGKNRVDVARDTSQLGIINGKSGEDPVGVCLPSPADISIED